MDCNKTIKVLNLHSCYHTWNKKIHFHVQHFLTNMDRINNNNYNKQKRISWIIMAYSIVFNPKLKRRYSYSINTSFRFTCYHRPIRCAQYMYVLFQKTIKFSHAKMICKQDTWNKFHISECCASGELAYQLFGRLYCNITDDASPWRLYYFYMNFTRSIPWKLG